MTTGARDFGSRQSAELFDDLRHGDPGAAAAIFERYAERLTRLARSKLAAKLAARVDPEDIVMSAYRSFFVAARDGRFEVERGGDLWRLLVEITLHKLYRQAEHHGAQRRSVRREQRSKDAADFESIAGREPTPAEALIAAEELEAILGQLPDRGRTIAELRLQGYMVEEIAATIGCSTRTVRRWLEELRHLMHQRAGSQLGPSRKSAKKKSKLATVQRPPRPLLPSVPGNLNWNDFLLEQQIGMGATGKVYRALQRSTGRRVAVKFLKKAWSAHEPTVRRFLEEAKTVARLNHPGIVAVHDVGRTPFGGYFLIMDLIEGLDLQRIASTRKISWQDAARWVADAAEIVHFAHEHGVIHCDLKPANLLLDGNAIRVTDFGLALNLDQLETKSDRIGGTPGFMAPEQVDRCWGPITVRTDVWGLGAVLYFLLTGTTPHRGRNVAYILSNVVSGRPVSWPTNLAEALPRDVADVCQKCLSKKPDERFASAMELASALRIALSRV